MSRKLCFLILGFLCCLSRMEAQESYPPKWNEFGFWGGYGPFPVQLLGTTSDRQLLDIAFRYGRAIKHCRQVQNGDGKTKPCHIQIDYTLDIIPVETMRQPTN